MKTLRFKKAKSLEEIEAIELLGKKIWNEHYIKIISQEQINYMLDKFQSTKSIQEQIQNGYEYFQILLNNNPAGYFGISAETGFLFLSKFYILDELRGKGIGKSAFAFIQKLAKEKGLDSIRITVNKSNTNSIEFYKKVGFEIKRQIVADIGCGYVMDDYEMEYSINPSYK